MKNCMKNTLKSSNGITLIALVITIIVLLILAGISISMLSGDNGILQKATDAKTNTEKANEKEQIQIEVLGSYNKNGELEIATVNSNIKSNIRGIITDDATEFPLIVTYTASGNSYEIDESGNTTKIIPPSADYLTLREGNTVYFKDLNNTDVECVVLYDSQNANYNTYGVEIITRNPVTTVELGNGTGVVETDLSNFDTAKDSYNGAIGILNTAAETYRKTNLSSIANSARCVGSIPDKPSTRNTELYSNSYSYFSSYNAQFETGESDSIYKASNTENYTVDWTQLCNLGIANITNTRVYSYYWLASRSSMGNTSNTVFNVRTAYKAGQISTGNICLFYSDDSVKTTSYAYGLRPVFTLNPGITITEINGKKYLNIS